MDDSNFVVSALFDMSTGITSWDQGGQEHRNLEQKHLMCTSAPRSLCAVLRALRASRG